MAEKEEVAVRGWGQRRERWLVKNKEMQERKKREKQREVRRFNKYLV